MWDVECGIYASEQVQVVLYSSNKIHDGIVCCLPPAGMVCTYCTSCTVVVVDVVSFIFYLFLNFLAVFVHKTNPFYPIRLPFLFPSSYDRCKSGG